MSDLSAFLDMLSGGNPDALLEARSSRKDRGMDQAWFRADADDLPRYIVEYGRRTDVFIGAAPRVRRAGGKSAVEVAHCLWVDCDEPEAVERLSAFEHAPTMTIASGTPGRLHAWWALSAPLPREWVERGNRRLAHYLGADPRCAEAARIMRPPETLNHKHDPPSPATVASDTGERFTISTLVANLSDPPTVKPRTPSDTVRSDSTDSLAAISPLDYFPRLTGREVGANGKAQCPWHSGGKERTPSLHVYADPARGFSCYGCDVAGDIYSLGAALWGLDTKRDFREIRERLERELEVTQ